MSVPLRLGIILLLACCVATLKVAKEVSRIKCENRRIFLSCGRYGLINVTSANYGRTDNSTCIRDRPTSQVSNTTCIQPSTLAEVAKRCEGKYRCFFPVHNKVFGNPCPGTYKYLQVTYTCIPTKRVIGCQNYYTVPWCAAGVIRINSAAYGRRHRRICSFRRPWWQLRNTRCSRDVKSIMAARCDGNQWCFKGATDKEFGDPCRGTYKYLDVNFSCLT